MKKTAIILGASGLTGNLLLNQLIADERYDSIVIFNRKSIGQTHPKVTEFIGDILRLNQFKKEFTGHEVYCCIGTTAKKTPDRSIYRNIDFGIPVAAAQLCAKNKIDTFLVISAMGANPGSNLFYNKTKGEMEQAVLSKKIPNTYILRPSFIGGDRNENRPGEKIGMAIAKMIQPLLVGKLRKYRLIEPDKIARAMVHLANSKPKSQVLTSDKIEALGSV